MFLGTIKKPVMAKLANLFINYLENYFIIVNQIAKTSMKIAHKK
jgi:hypothetical protein